MENGVGRGGAQATEAQRARALDVVAALAMAEGAISERVLDAYNRSNDGTAGASPSGAERPPLYPSHNAFGDALAVDIDQDVRSLLHRAAELAAAGRRVAVLARASALASSRDALEAIAAQRLGTVVHAIADADTGIAPALSLADLGWGVLFSGGVLDSIDLAFIARRAAEDSGTPFVVVHEVGAVRFTEPVIAPPRELCESYVGVPSARIRRRADAAHPAHADVSTRAFAERVPFALGSAMRELEALTGRRHDVFERIPSGDAALVVVALGLLGEPLLAEVDRLRAAGHDVAALRVTALRPFPGPRLVKALSRALGITVLEAADLPLAQSNPLTRELKSAFADALTWAPDYPGVGRIPRVFSGVIPTGHELDSSDIDAALENMVNDERGKRLFFLGRGQHHLAIPSTLPAPSASVPLSFRGRVRDVATAAACADVCAAVVSSVLGLRIRAAVRHLSGADGDGVAFDVVASRDRSRGAHVPHAIRVIAFDDPAALLRGNPLARLASKGGVAIPTTQRTPEAVWAEVPPYAKALLHDRRARLVGWSLPDLGSDPNDARWILAASFAGLAVSGASVEGRAAVDASLVAREVFQVLTHTTDGPGEAVAKRAAEAARAAFESSVDVPRSLIDKDDDAVRLGRRDARSSVPPR